MELRNLRVEDDGSLVTLDRDGNVVIRIDAESGEITIKGEHAKIFFC